MGLFNRLFKRKEAVQEMSDVNATLSLANESYEVVKLDFDIAQDVYSKNHQEGNVYGGRIKCTIRGTLSNKIIAWGIYNYHRESGEIRFGKPNYETDFTIRFENANCLHLTRHVRVGETELTELVIAPHLIKIGGDEFENQWKTDKIYG